MGSSRQYVVTDYAVGRLRERLRVHGRKVLEKQTTEELKNLLDESVKQGILRGRGKPFNNQDGQGVMVDIQDGVGVPLWAFVRPDRTKTKKLTGREAIVTVMEHALVDRINASGGIGKPDPKVLQDIARLDENTEPRLVVWTNGGPDTLYKECLARDLPSLVDGLVKKGITPGDIRVWKPVQVKTRVVVEEH